MTYDYFYGQQSELFTFYRVPKVLFTNERFWNISADAKMLYGILLAQEEIDHFLLLGSNTDEARKIIALEYMKQKLVEEIAQALKEVYHGGFGIKEDSGNISAWYAENGIHLAKGF